MVYECLSVHWPVLITDGHSTILGRNGGLTELLPEEYPWLHMAHRFELAVNDSLKDITCSLV